MKTRYAFRSRFFALAAFALVLVPIAHADEVTVTGSTQGQFDLQPLADSNSLFGLSFSNSTFDNTTVDGFLALGGDPNPGSNFNNLGSFTLDTPQNIYQGHKFSLVVTFTAPTTIVGGSTATFSADLFGAVDTNHHGGVMIDFDNTPQVFNFTNPTATGSFSLQVNDVSVAPGQTASITGTVLGDQSAVPEPASIAVLAIGALGLMRRSART